MKCDVEMYWTSLRCMLDIFEDSRVLMVFRTLWYACQELSTLGWGQRAFTGQLSCDLLPKTWWSKHGTRIFRTGHFSKRKFKQLNHLAVSRNKRDLESNLPNFHKKFFVLIWFCYVCSTRNLDVCSPNLLFQKFANSVWPRWGVLFEDRWRLRPHNYVKWLKCFGYAWIGSTG